MYIHGVASVSSVMTLSCRGARPIEMLLSVFQSCEKWLVYTQMPHNLQNGDIVTIQGLATLPGHSFTRLRVR